MQTDPETGEVLDSPPLVIDTGYRPGYYYPRPIEVPATDELLMRGKLAAKLAECYDKVARIPERGFNKFHGYKYVLAEDLYSAVRDAFHEVGLVVLPMLHHFEESFITGAKGQERRKIVQPMTFLVMDSETGFSLALPWHSEAMDDEDKGTGKALTSALKYFLKTLLIIPTGDDPDAGQAPAETKVEAKSPEQLAAESAQLAADAIVAKTRSIATTIKLSKAVAIALRQACTDSDVDFAEALIEAHGHHGPNAEKIIRHVCQWCNVVADGLVLKQMGKETQPEPEPEPKEAQPEPEPKPKDETTEARYYAVAKELGWPHNRNNNTEAQFRVFSGVCRSERGSGGNIGKWENMRASDWVKMLDFAINAKEGVVQSPKLFEGLKP